jgi:hypothetical protein
VQVVWLMAVGIFDAPPISTPGPLWRCPHLGAKGRFQVGVWLTA